MEVNVSDAIGFFGIVVTAIGGAIAYGSLKNRVCSLEKRADGAKTDREKLFDTTNQLRADTDVQGEKIGNLEGAREELFRLARDTNETLNNISASLQVLTAEFKKLEEVVKNKNVSKIV